MTTCDFCGKHIDEGKPAFFMAMELDIYLPRKDPAEQGEIDEKIFMGACQDCADKFLRRYRRGSIKNCMNCRERRHDFSGDVPVIRCGISGKITEPYHTCSEWGLDV